MINCWSHWGTQQSSKDWALGVIFEFSPVSIRCSTGDKGQRETSSDLRSQGKNLFPIPFTNTPSACPVLSYVINAEHNVIWYGVTLWSVSVSSRLCPLQAPCTPPGTSLWGQCEEQRRLSCSVSTVQRELKQHCVFNTVLIIWRKVTPSQPKPV